MRTYERHELAQGQLKPLPEGLPKTHVEIIAEGETPIVTPPDERSKLTIEQVEAAERIRAREEARPIEEEIPALEHIATAVEELDKKPKFTDEELRAILQAAHGLERPGDDLVGARREPALDLGRVVPAREHHRGNDRGEGVTLERAHEVHAAGPCAVCVHKQEAGESAQHDGLNVRRVGKNLEREVLDLGPMPNEVRNRSGLRRMVENRRASPHPLPS